MKTYWKDAVITERIHAGLYRIGGLLVHRERHSELTKRVNDHMNSRRHETIWQVYRRFSPLDDGTVIQPISFAEFKTLKEAKTAITTGKVKL
jgi:hypothetical protein